MVCRKCNIFSLSCLNPLLGSRFIILYFIIMIFVICTSYDYIINVSVGNTKYATFLGVGMIAQLKKDKPVESKLADLPPPFVISKLERRLEDNQALNQSHPQPTRTVKEVNANITQNKDLKTEPPKSSTKNIKEINMNEKDGDMRPSEIQTNLNQTIDTLEQMNNYTLVKCNEIPSHLQGKLQIVKEVLNLSSVLRENPTILPGGEDSPANCTTRHNVAIIVPYRDRSSQLAVFLRHIHPFLRRQDLHYRIYIINQADGHLFNRAMLMNVGFTEAMQDYSWDCCIFHDVDLLPEDDRNLYTCPDQPRHMSVAVDKFKYKLPYKTIFGGVAAISVQQFRELNGFSNQFWGWGGEDDDMAKRIQHHKLSLTRYKPAIARYTMVKHKQETVNKERGNILKNSHKRYNTDGLNSLSYTLLSKGCEPLYTNVTIQLNKPVTEKKTVKKTGGIKNKNEETKQKNKEENKSEPKPSKKVKISETKPSKQEKITETKPAKQEKITETKPSKQEKITETKPSKQEKITETKPSKQEKITEKKPSKKEKITEPKPKTENSTN